MTKHLLGAARREFIATVVDRYVAGDSIRGIAAATGYSYTAIRDILVRQRVTLRPRGSARGWRS